MGPLIETMRCREDVLRIYQVVPTDMLINGASYAYDPGKPSFWRQFWCPHETYNYSAPVSKQKIFEEVADWRSDTEY